MGSTVKENEKKIKEKRLGTLPKLILVYNIDF